LLASGVVLFSPCDERGGRIRTDAHDLSAEGFELRHCRFEAQHFLRSDAREGGDERIEDDWALGGQVRELDRFTIGAVEREVGRLLADLEGADGGGEQRLARTPAGNPVTMPRDDLISIVSFRGAGTSEG
jgi:hypothetical protein